METPEVLVESDSRELLDQVDNSEQLEPLASLEPQEQQVLLVLTELLVLRETEVLWEQLEQLE